MRKRRSGNEREFYWERFSSKDPTIVDLCHKEFRGWTSGGTFMDRDGLGEHVKDRQEFRTPWCWQTKEDANCWSRGTVPLR